LIKAHRRLVDGCLGFLAATKMPGAASASARAYQPEQHYWLRHALEFVAAALLSHEEARYLALHPRRDHDRARFGHNLRPRCDVRHVAENLACRVDHRRPGVDGDARGKRRLSSNAFLRFSSASGRWIASAARAARSASFSCATG
jgi:hypothetical protein